MRFGHVLHNQLDQEMLTHMGRILYLTGLLAPNIIIEPNIVAEI